MKTVVAVHTDTPMVEPTKKLFAEQLPGVRLINIVEDGLIRDVIEAGGVTGSVKKRLNGYYDSAVEAGADLIFNTCSSVGDVAMEARERLGIPLVKIDDAMARKAVQSGTRIGVLATLGCTLDPTIRLLKSEAGRTGRDIKVIPGLAEGAYDSVVSGDRDKHDQLILEAARKIAGRVDLIVLAQGSMARIQDDLARITGKPVLASPASGFEEVRTTLEKMSE